MTEHNTERRTDLQGSLNEHHMQGSLDPIDPDMLMSAGKEYNQKDLDSSGQPGMSREQAGVPVQRALSGEGESRKAGVQRIIVAVVIAFVHGLLVAFLIFRTLYAPSSDTNEGIAGAEEEAVSIEREEETPAGEKSAGEEETVAADAIVEIPDPVLKKAIQTVLGIGDREITGADALLLTEAEFEGFDDEQNPVQIKDITGLSAFKNLTYLNLSNNQVSDISVLSGLTNLTMLSLFDNQISDISALSGLTNLEGLHLSNNQISDIGALSGLTNLKFLYLYENQISDISVLSGFTNLTELLLSSNQIGDISALSGLNNLEVLSLDNNQLSDISALSGLTNLKQLHLTNNQIRDISALSGLTNLEVLYLRDNPVLREKSREEIMEVLSGAEKLTDSDY